MPRSPRLTEPRTITKVVRLHRAQHEFRLSTAAYRGFVGGRGAGKTFAGAYDLIRRARKGRLYLVAAPTYPMLADATLRTFLDLAREFCILRPGDYTKQPPRILLSTGAEILFRSADDPDRLRGPNLSGIWLDEASLMPREVFEIAIACLREGGESGWLSATFTPRGRGHWTYPAFGSGRPGSEMFRARTVDNPFVSPEFVRQVRTQYSGLRALQELEGQFVAMEGVEWPESYFDDSIWYDTPPANPICRVCALDPSKGRDAHSGDYAAFVDLLVDAEGCLWVEADLYRGASAEVLVDTVIERTRRLHPDAFAVEVNQFQELLAVLIRDRAARQQVLVPVVPIDNHVNKLVRIRRLGPYLHEGRIRFRDTPGTRLLVDQMREFPEGPHDDGCDAAEMAVRVASQLLDGTIAPESEETSYVHA